MVAIALITSILIIKPFTKTCAPEYNPTCGIDGITYENPCLAGKNNIAYLGPCTTKCTEEQRQAEICTLDYNPVCGNDRNTYSNICTACSSGKVEYWTEGECPSS